MHIIRINKKLVMVLILVLLYSLLFTGVVFAATSNNLAGTGGSINLSGSDDNWSGNTNITTDNTSYASVTIGSNGGTSNYLYASNFGFSIPTNATINGIEVTINRYFTSGGLSIISDSQVRIVKAGAVAGTTASPEAWPENLANISSATYGGASDLWGTTWTPAQINAANFGAALSVTRNSGGDATAYVDYIRIIITYTASTPTPTPTTGPTPTPSPSPPNNSLIVAPANINVYAAVFGIKYGFGNESAYQYSDTYPQNAGTINLRGSIIQAERLSVGIMSNGVTRGYYKSYAHDPRMLYNNPPYFSPPENSGWEVITWKEVEP